MAKNRTYSDLFKQKAIETYVKMDGHLEAAAKALKIDKSTLWRWLCDPKVKQDQAIDEISKTRRIQYNNRAWALLYKSLDILRKKLVGATVPQVLEIIKLLDERLAISATQLTPNSQVNEEAWTEDTKAILIKYKKKSNKEDTTKKDIAPPKPPKTIIDQQPDPS